jgi:hypothetical protein
MGEHTLKQGVYLLIAAFVVNIIVTIKGIKDRSKIGPILLASNLAADFHLIAAIFVYGIVSLNSMTMNGNGLIISLIVGASIANLVFLISNISDIFVSRGME